MTVNWVRVITMCRNIGKAGHRNPRAGCPDFRWRQREGGCNGTPPGAGSGKPSFDMLKRTPAKNFRQTYRIMTGPARGMLNTHARASLRAGIRVIPISPGWFPTPMIDGVPQEIADRVSANAPLPPRMGGPDEYAALAKQKNKDPFPNGTTIRLDDAVRLPPR